jgi:hypothetical protein
MAGVGIMVVKTSTVVAVPQRRLIRSDWIVHIYAYHVLPISPLGHHIV